MEFDKAISETCVHETDIYSPEVPPSLANNAYLEHPVLGVPSGYEIQGNTRLLATRWNSGALRS